MLTVEQQLTALLVVGNTNTGNAEFVFARVFLLGNALDAARARCDSLRRRGSHCRCGRLDTFVVSAEKATPTDLGHLWVLNGDS
jgi:hypothetical protein